MHTVRKSDHNWLALETSNRSYSRYRERFTGTVADLGCGTAPYRKDLLETADRYIGVDWPNSMHDQSHVTVFANLSERIDLPDESVDAAMVMHVMEHLCEPELFLDEVRRILKPGGFLLIAVPFNWQLHEEPHDYYRYTPYCLEYLLKKHGYGEIEVTPEGGFFTTVFLKSNYVLRSMLRGPLRYIGIPYWYLNQRFAKWIDAYHPTPRECTAVTAVAVKVHES